MKATAKTIRPIKGRSTSSKTICVVSDLHIGSKFSLYSGNLGYKISPEQQKLLDHWRYSIDKIGKVDMMLCNGDLVDGSNPKANAYQLWTGDMNEQILECERLLKEWKFNKILMTKGSGYHVQQGQTSFEETLGARMGSIRYSQMFDEAINSYSKSKGKYDTKDQFGRHVNYYVFFEVNNSLVSATHHVGWSKWQANSSGAIMRELSDLQGFGRGRYFADNRTIDLCIRSHVHRFVYVEDAFGKAFTSAAFKHLDAHLMRAGLGGTYPDIGVVQVIFENGNNEIIVKKCLMPKDKMPQPQVIRI
jgi:hypothetical protein